MKMRLLCLSAALLVLLVILVDSTPVNIHHVQDEGTKIVEKGASVLTRLTEIINKALKGQVMISGIQFDNYTQEELPTLQIEYSTLSEETEDVETSHKQGLEKRSIISVAKGILSGVIKGTKIFGKGASILTELAEIVKKAVKGQVMIAGIQFDNHTQEELPTLQIEYSKLIEENEGVETSHKQGLEKRSLKDKFKKVLGGVIKGAKIVGKGVKIVQGMAEVLNKTLQGQVMISSIHFDNQTEDELPTLEIEYTPLVEENEGVETSHKQGLEKRSLKDKFKKVLGGVIKGAKIVGKGVKIVQGIAEVLNKTLKGQATISSIHFDNQSEDELPTLEIEYSTLVEENEGVETSHKQGLEKRSLKNKFKKFLGGVIKGAKIVGKGVKIVQGMAEVLNKTLQGQVMISSIHFDNQTEDELPTLEIEYTPLVEENEGVETSHKQGLEKRSLKDKFKKVLGGMIKGAKIVGKGVKIVQGIAEVLNKTLKGQATISSIHFDNQSEDELPTLEIEYSTLVEENEGVETSHKQGLEKRSLKNKFKKFLGGVIKGAKIVGKGVKIVQGMAEVLNKTLQGQVMISSIHFDNQTEDELPTLEIEYTPLVEENEGVETSHKQGLEKRSLKDKFKKVLGGVIKGAKIVGKGVKIVQGIAEVLNKTLQGQATISSIHFDNQSEDELPTLEIEYSTLVEENEGVETSHKQGLEKRSLKNKFKKFLGGVIKGAKIVGKGVKIVQGMAEVLNKTLQGQVMISSIHFDNQTEDELPTLEIEYTPLVEENEGVETSHKQGLEKRSLKDKFKKVLGGVIKGAKIVGKGVKIVQGIAEVLNKTLQGQATISSIHFDNQSEDELPTLEIEYSTLVEENEGVETSHKQGLEKRSLKNKFKKFLGGVIKGAKIVGKGVKIVQGMAEVLNKTLQGQVMISSIHFDNQTEDELPTLEIEYTPLVEENEGVETSHKQGLEKRSLKDKFKKVLGGVIKGAKIVGKGVKIVQGIAEVLNKTLKGQATISSIHFDNQSEDELPTLEIEYSTLVEENEGVETSHKQGLEKRSLKNKFKKFLGGVIKGAKIVGKGVKIVQGMAEVLNKTLQGQVMISSIHFDNQTEDELPTLEIEYTPLVEENEGVETSHKQGLEKRSLKDKFKKVLGGVIKGAKIVGKGVKIVQGIAEVLNKTLKGQATISSIHFDNQSEDELPTLEIEYSTLVEENEGVETSHKQGLEKRSLKNKFKKFLGGVIKGAKIVGKGVKIVQGMAEVLNKTLQGQVMISSIHFDNQTEDELPTLEIEYTPLVEENEGVETSHKQGLEKRSLKDKFKKVLGGVIKGAKIVGKGVKIVQGIAEVLNKTLKGQATISSIHFDNQSEDELPTLEIEYSTLVEENEGVETSHKQGLEKRSLKNKFKKFLGGVIKGAKIVGKGVKIVQGMAEVLNKTLQGQVMISSIHFDNQTEDELPTLEIEYTPLVEENEGVETSHKQGLEKRSLKDKFKKVLGGVIKGAKIVGKGVKIVQGIAEVLNKTLKDQATISSIHFNNQTEDELPTLEIEYSTLVEENEGVETSHKQGLEKRSLKNKFKTVLGGVIKGAKIVGKGVKIIQGLADVLNKTLKGQVMISRIQFDNHTQEELPTLNIEYLTLSEENKGVETNHNRLLEKRSVVHVVKSILGGVIKGTKIFGKGASILTELAEIVNKALKGQVMISGIQFENHLQEELPTLNMEYSTLSEEHRAFMPAFCVEPKFDGVCKTMMVRYFFNTQTGRCELFLYGGCGGNRNNFQTLDECRRTCHPRALSQW